MAAQAHAWCAIPRYCKPCAAESAAAHHKRSYGNTRLPQPLMRIAVPAQTAADVPAAVKEAMRYSDAATFTRGASDLRLRKRQRRASFDCRRAVCAARRMRCC